MSVIDVGIHRSTRRLEDVGKSVSKHQQVFGLGNFRSLTLNLVNKKLVDICYVQVFMFARLTCLSL